MRENPERRTTLVNAVIDVLADAGARKLTFRAVDERAGVPVGTATNYFPNRDAMLAQAAAHVHQRLAPRPEVLTEMASRPPGREVVRWGMHDLYARVSADRRAYLALLELRLEGTRRPELGDVLLDTIGANIRANLEFHVEGDYPGGVAAFTALYLAMTGLLTEHLTLPAAWEGTEFDAVIDDIVDRVIPE
ncbi:TetR family transcriptional regulator [Spiractinospora alimapuensis]|uniref:TetR/AcrR family transcriptional regulator n=1 Tax=Spiractinospora alimapuensis TaxID=2820884 RepID=UPI001F17220C|nr:TetR/AcrR family transcriptional regulator [Spiractinospora alimapuensis]QVQ50399.1 TetR family transcriptional regulator [Spiractinospora alimapuensis]